MFREICSECRVLLFWFKEPELSCHILEIEYQNKTSNKCIQENKTSNKRIQENKTTNKRIQENKTSNKCFQENKTAIKKEGNFTHNRYNLSTFISLFFIIQVLLKDFRFQLIKCSSVSGRNVNKKECCFAPRNCSTLRYY